MMSLDKVAYWHLKKKRGRESKNKSVIKNEKKKQVNWEKGLQN